MKPCRTGSVFRVLSYALALFAAGSARAQESTNGFAFADFLLAPLRVHLLTATNEPAIHTTLTSNDVTRILGKVNRVWAQAGITFYLESLRIEPTANATNYLENTKEDERATLLSLRPKASLATNCFHVFYLKRIRPNGVYFNAQGIFVKDTASLRPVEGGLDEPLPRVTSHELGHALTLPHRQEVTNLLASGMSGGWLNAAEIRQAREAAKKKAWIQPAPEVLRQAEERDKAGAFVEGRRFWQRLAHLPLESDVLRAARRRSGTTGK
ncbi:MAG: Matrixin [Limisphaerales bacterium]|nr:MAG: Matrixin [Limisphaerales bacterium]KAG0509440.1 MAG: Matrixin [Limisphaerales bacterium]TXT52277.1 MAG: Matrixin [Limisphaerales bacterium]